VARNALVVLAASLFVIIVLVVLVGGGGIDSGLRRTAEVQLTKYESEAPAFRDAASKVETLLDRESALLAADAEAWRGRLEGARARFEQAGGEAEELRTLVEQNDPEAADRVATLQKSISELSTESLAVVTELEREATELVRFRDELPSKIAEMEADREAIEAFSLASVTEAVRRAQGDWPAKADDLEGRLRALTGAKGAAARVWSESAGARSAGLAGDATAAEVRALADAAEAMGRTRADLAESDRLKELIDELYFSWDRVLVDMVLNEGSEVTFTQSLRTVYIPATLAEDGTSPDGRRQRTEERTVTVTKAEYEAMKNNLGMTVAHKPAGKYDHEAERTVQPGGYAYIAEPGQRNRYGYWNGGFWVWYGQYALMRDLFWGPSYRRIGRDDYASYNRHRSVGRPYYGENNNRYGSRGSATRAKYGSSRYVQTNGYANSRYERSGGSYRGSRYESRSTSRSSRGGGYSRSGSRGGGK